MPFISYDPRDTIRQKIGTSAYDFKEQKTTYTIQVADSRGKTVVIPMLLSENCQRESIPEMPFIKMHRALTTYEPHDVRGAVRRMTSYIDIKLYFQNVDNITPVDFKQLVLAALQDGIRTNQSITTDTFFMNIIEERDQEENDGRQVTFIYVITLKCDFSDACD